MVGGGNKTLPKGSLFPEPVLGTEMLGVAWEALASLGSDTFPGAESVNASEFPYPGPGSFSLSLSDLRSSSCNFLVDHGGLPGSCWEHVLFPHGKQMEVLGSPCPLISFQPCSLEHEGRAAP